MKIRYLFLTIVMTVLSTYVCAQRATIWNFDCNVEPVLGNSGILYTHKGDEKCVTFANGIMTVDSKSPIYPRIIFGEPVDITNYPTATIKVRTTVENSNMLVEIRKHTQPTGARIGDTAIQEVPSDGEWHELTFTLPVDNYVGNVTVSFREKGNNDKFAEGIFEIDHITVGGSEPTSLESETASIISITPTIIDNEIVVSSVDNDIEFSIFTLDGVKTSTFKGNGQITADLSALSAGAYLIVVESAGETVTKRFIKK